MKLHHNSGTFHDAYLEVIENGALVTEPCFDSRFFVEAFNLCNPAESFSIWSNYVL